MESLQNNRKKLTLPIKMLIGLVIGVALGLVFGDKIECIGFIGDIFMSLLRMVSYPMVFFSIIYAVAGVSNILRLRKTGICFLIYVILGSAICAIVGVISCMIIKPGMGMDLSTLEAGEAVSVPEEYSLINTIVGWIPQNPFAAMANGELIQLIFFAFFFGIVLSTLRIRKKSADTLYLVIEGINDVIIRMVEIILEVAPFGICALMAVLIGSSGVDLMAGIGKYLLSFYAAFCVVFFILYPILIKFVAGLELKQYYKRVLPIIITAVTTMSSMGTLPVTMEVTKRECGVPEDTVNLLAPIGATVNMHGAAILHTTYAFFTLYVYGLDIKPSSLAIIIILSIAMAIGGSGIPGGGIITCSVMLNIMGLPLTLVPVIAGIFTLLDIGATLLNVLGDNICMILISKYMGELDEGAFAN